MGGVGSGAKPRLSKKERIKRASARKKKWRSRNKEKEKEKSTAYARSWRVKNPDKVSQTLKNYRQKTKEKELKKYFYDLQYARNHPGRCQKYYYANREKMLARQNEYNKIRRKKLA